MRIYSKESSFMKRIWLTSLLLLTLNYGSASAAEQKSYELPALTGNYEVGTVCMPMLDQKRPGVYADGTFSTGREFMTQIWYPSERRAAGPKSVYLDEPTADYLSQFFKASGLDIDKDFRFLIKTHAVVNAKAANRPARFPVLIFSPGWNMSYFIYQSILEDLASHGYIVIGVNSPNSAGITVFPDGHSHVTPDIEDEEIKNKYNQEVADDLTFVADSLPKLDTNAALPLFGRIDFKRVGCFGHSFGGAAAIQACLQSPNIIAAMNFDGSPRGESYIKPVSKPMMMVWSDLHPQADTTMDVIWSSLPKGSYRLTLNGTDHMSFSDYMMVTEFIYGKSVAENPHPIYPERAVQITRDITRTFFDIKLNHTNPQHMNKLAKKYQEIKLDAK